MNLKEIYLELQQIDEFHANFNPTDKSSQRMRTLVEKVKNFNGVRFIANVNTKLNG